MLAAALAGYVLADGSWQLFVLLILAPDLAMLGYLAGPAAGAHHAGVMLEHGHLDVIQRAASRFDRLILLAGPPFGIGEFRRFGRLHAD